MKNKFLAVAFLSIFLLISHNVQAANFIDNQTVEKDKKWTIKFTGDVGFDDVSKQGITITDSNGALVNVGIVEGEDKKTIIVTAPEDGYIQGESYILNIGSKVHSAEGKALKKEYKIHFNIKKEVLEQQSCNGNLLNKSFVAKQGDWIYYRNLDDGSKLYKKNEAQEAEKIKLSDRSASNINVVGDWVYFIDFIDDFNTKICKVKTDGSDETIVCKANYDSGPYANDDKWDMTVVGDWIYYHDDYYAGDGKDSIYKIKTDGTCKQMVCDCFTDSMIVYGDWIYYRDALDCKIYKVTTDGKNKSKLNDDGSVQAFKIGGIIDGWIYYSYSSDVYKVRIDGSEKTKIFNIEHDNKECVSNINVSNGWMYYRIQCAVSPNNSDVDGKVFKVKLDGSCNTKLFDGGFDVIFMNVIDDVVFVTNETDVLRSDTGNTFKVFPPPKPWTRISPNNTVVIGLSQYSYFDYYKIYVGNTSEQGPFAEAVNSDWNLENKWKLDCSSISLPYFGPKMYIKLTGVKDGVESEEKIISVYK
ncbi:hypothetical protein Ccar_05255 [Clostridium carboxidivorans P7]|uniref:Prolow-density lipoprotein receptor-related protein 1-like beta-propeller domain-containing protein n=1 Tax=Clostridium carboxidivorans P7 TaxID=536227 RepID=C6Q163_9CLOT|nr:DUF5050 domain-containing protein [Clostridium carboxidivorans]AKN30263.1 hypothetical protein Ccar_05255 [Clostridium carboxidivorans P7]EET84763.1 hypothetical protein CcarbDRAFT_4780 [Clostridium carboxidivorans P7]